MNDETKIKYSNDRLDSFANGITQEDSAQREKVILDHDLEQQRQELLQKILVAQIRLRLADRQLEQTKKFNLTQTEQRQLEKWLDILQTVLFGVLMSTKQRESLGEIISPEERSVEAMNAEVDIKRGFGQEDLWGSSQFITEEYIRSRRSMANDKTMSEDLSSHIRK